MKTLNVVYSIFLCLPAITGAFAQRQPETAHVNLYFPLILDGGPKSEQFQTTFTLTNTGAVQATIALFPCAPDGSPWKLDLGSGALTKHEFTIPVGGSRRFTTSIGKDITQGWAVAVSSAPIQAVAVVREIATGFTAQQMMIQPVLPALDYIWPGDKNSLISLANLYSDSSTKVDVTFLDSEGKPVADKATLTIPPRGQTVFSVSDKFPNIGDKAGSIVVSGVDRPHDTVVATSLAGTGQGILSALPNGSVTWPISHFDRTWMTYLRVINSAQKLGVISDTPDLRILGGQEVNAFAQGGTTVSVTLGLSQLISDSPSELAFALAHEVGHIYQQRTGKLEFHTNPEFDADIWGSFLSLSAGFDPYGAAGTLAKLSMATGRASLSSQFEDQLASDAHKSFNERLDNIFDVLTAACNMSAEMKQICRDYKSIIHPNLPPVAPLFRSSGLEGWRPAGELQGGPGSR